MDILELEKLLNHHIPLDKTFPSSLGEDYGLIIHNTDDAKRILYCVTLDDKVIKYAKKNFYDTIITHHPTFIYSGNIDVNIFTYHTAFDFCDRGLSDKLADIIGLKSKTPIVNGSGGFYGTIEKTSFSSIVNKIENVFGYSDGIIRSRKFDIESVAVCSGLGGFIHNDVEQLNVDCFITGQVLKPFEKTSSNSIIEIGHTKSERIGIDILREFLYDNDIVIDIVPEYLDSFGREVY